MLTRIALALCLVLGSPQAPTAGVAPRAQSGEPLVATPLRQRMRSLTNDIAKTGEASLVERMRGLLALLGDSPVELERAQRSWERTLQDAKPGRATRKQVAERLQRDLAPLVQELERAQEPRRGALARGILTLDANEPVANAALGNTRDADGEWLSEEEHTWKRGAGRVNDLARAAESLAFSIETGASRNPALLQLTGSGRFAAMRGIELHAPFAPEILERILRQALRAAALSRGILFGDLALPASFRPRVLVFLDKQDLYAAALEEARASGGLSPADHRRTLDLRMGSFEDGRGWRVEECQTEAQFEAVVLWHLLYDWLEEDVQPCLRVGHLNWLCLRFLGTSMPLVVWSAEGTAKWEASQSSARQAQGIQPKTLWRSARQSLWGSRAWLIEEVRAGRDPIWARSMLDQDGKIRDSHLLKTTSVCEFLQVEGRLTELVAATRGTDEPVAAFERALGQPLPLLEERWRRWLDPARARGIRQALEVEPADVADSPTTQALRALNQARADALKGQDAEIPLVTLDPDLSRAAQLHARYLTLHPDQRVRWPEAHQESAELSGFTPEGALSASRSLIAIHSDPQAAVQAWLGTFYHRLPLLEPGLFGVGFGHTEEVVVLDVHSLVLAPWKDHVVVWPLPDARDVPLRFVPEQPNPVPAADMATLGYPVSIQLTFARPEGATELVLELFQGEPERGPAVPCHRVSPEAPPQPDLAPENAWGLIPTAPLTRATRYTARAKWGEQSKVWSFTTAK